jgi:hypothetical protein
MMPPRGKDRQIRNSRTLSTFLTALLAAALLGFAAGPAMAQDDPTDAQYDPVNEVIDTEVASGDQGAVGGASDPGDPGTGTGTSVGSLPFTGLDVALASVVAALLIGTGLLMRRAAREQSV